MTWRVFAVLVLSASACRDLSLPELSTLSVQADLNVVAPRQKMHLTASGGAGSGYQFAFAAEGQGSGALATVSADGLYQAGERGQTRDLVVVSDAAGNRAQLKVSIGPSLSLSPALSSVAPGGHLTFVAAGGLPPWRFTLQDGTELVDGAYVAAAPGNRVDTVTLRDATDDPAAVATAQVSVGNGLLVYPAEVSLAPLEKLGFVALGGAPPYTFSLTPDAGSAGTVAPHLDAATGLYTAGSNDQNAGVPDEVLVTDGNGQVAHALVHVGAPLQFTLLAPTGHPGTPQTVSATGGRPPYTFAFQPRGNRSRGTIDAVVGTYVPGVNSGAIDLLQVTDVTGSVSLAPPVVIGSRQLVVPLGGAQFTDALLDRDSQRDLALLFNNDLVTVFGPGQPTPQVRHDVLASPGNLAWQVVPYDVDADGRTDLVTLTQLGFEYLHSTFGGQFQVTSVTTPGNYPASRAALVGDSLYRFRTDTCAGIERLTMASVALSPVRTCVFPATGRAFGLAGSAATSSRYLSWLVADPRVAGEPFHASTPMQFRYLDPTGAVTRSAQLSLPPGFRAFERSRTGGVGNTTNGLNSMLDDPAAVGPDRLFMLVDEIDAGVSHLWGVDPTGPTSLFLSSEIPTPFPTAGLASTRSIDGRTQLASWDTRTGTVPVLTVELDAGVHVTQTLQLDAPATSARFVDLDSDGLADLVTTSAFSTRLDVFPSDGDGSFGRRPRFNVDSAATSAVTDLDGDGVSDLVVGVTGGIATYFGVKGSSQLAVGPRTALLVNPVWPLVADVDGDGRADLYFQDDQGAMWFAPGAGPAGAFGVPSQVLNPAGGIDRAIGGAYTPMELGGAAPGPDLLTVARDPTTNVVSPMLVARLTTTTARRLFLPLPPGYTSFACLFFPMQVDGLGADDLVAGCGDTSTFTVFVAIATGTGPNLAFDPWVAAAHPGPAFDGDFGVQMLTSPAGDAKRYLLAQNAASTGDLLVISASGGTLSTTVRSLPVSVDLAAFGALVPGATEPQLVTSTSALNALIVYTWAGGAYVERQRVGVSGIDTLVPVTTQAGGPADVLFGFGAQVTTLRNDGTGLLR